jgi:hypothetical protein
LAGRFSCAVEVYDYPGVSHAIDQPSGLLVGREWPLKQVVEKERAQGFNGRLGERR